MDYVLPLFVGLPLATVAIAAMAPWRWLRDTLALLTPLGIVIAGCLLFAQVAQHGTMAHAIGHYVGGVAISFAADPFAAIMIITTALVALCANWFAIVVGETRSRFYPSLSLMLLTGVMGALLTADLFNFFVFMEVMLLPSYALVAMTGTWARLSAGRTFVLVNLATSTLLLIGVALLYGVAGAVNIAALAGAARGHGSITVAMGVIVVALVIKAGIFPVHTWLPRSYPATSASVMGLFSALHTKVAVYMLMRIYVVIFDLDSRWMWLIITICVISMIVGAFGGLGEKSMRQILAYQMINGMPMILVVLAFTQRNPQALIASGIFYALHHMITLGSLILTSGAVEETYGTDKIKKLSGIARRDPLVAAVFASGAFSVVGFPPFSGLWGKVFLILSIASADAWQSWLVIAVIITASFGAFLAMLRLWRKVYWGAPMRHLPETLRVPFSRLAPGAVMIVMSLSMFIFAGQLYQATNQAASGLLDVTGYQQAVLYQGEQPPVAVVTGDNLQGGR
ncbi:Na(+)/H(+) antiporter subunit D [Corynebacterium kutscheri]|uniref:Formate hydrogenlyase subunit 3/multisubunit Na+/H+ antiporter, MnhD subunit n=1 Tax=Corynebacterium kutscheri TaxID=35755 RepID=A0A0F6TCK2_9CORY|nr:monovalent cation/H+ antiporter subunit D family protein [Corynebacterium kutscheri]AKE40401.1 formate hydrogenlyase subunit 3/multisubunit Na+/H+ antiporter, MnhD subunit [Corynebacterium kutscheri]VEH05277.1 Na(+)/H(+) antiporter subunit D [Corynebacterium kutscheri]VEH10796.1 Na(+)/H(+) antiporter subunit D [Corynebacterium kutscheri]VEH80725.1 Na(+)/H(+) antiporter subunit D [Corynebacterium kutscheri]